jgi:hypothetical protein
MSTPGFATVIDEQSKATEIYSYFDSMLGSAPARSNSINLDAMGLPTLNMQELGNRFKEVWGVSLPS